MISFQDITRRPPHRLPAMRRNYQEDCLISHRIRAEMLNYLELTGRTTTHVRAAPEHNCTLHPQAGEALTALRNQAREAGISLKVVSSFRDFRHQASIWSAKFNGQRRLLDHSGREIARESLDEPALIDAILIWSALPGASRHHWGTEIDVIDAASLPEGREPLIAQEFAPGGCFERLDRWLTANMHLFGFFRPYSTDRGGVQPEPWHLSYGEVSVPALEGLSLEVLTEAILCETNLPGRQMVLARLPELYSRYVTAVDSP
jgi:LAS superfamily LD-carboxypeptidase LdcB